MCVTKEKRDVRRSHHRILLLNCVCFTNRRLKYTFKRIDIIIITLRGNSVSSVCPIIQPQFNARKQRIIKRENTSKNELDASQNTKGTKGRRKRGRE